MFWGDDREVRPGVKFADCDLLGIPHRVVIGERALDEGELEYRHRQDEAPSRMPLESAVSALVDRVRESLDLG